MPDQQPDFRQFEAQAANFFKKLMLPMLILIVISWVASGFYMVGPGEIGVVRRFGKEINRTHPGLHYRIPWPVDKVVIVNVEQVRRAEIGFRSVRGVSRRVPEEALMLTGDENIVDAQLIVQYQVKDASLYLFQVEQPEVVLHTTAEVALRSTVGGLTIDDLLTVGREKVQIETQAFLQRLLDNYRTGLRVTEVRLQVVDPPDQVKDAFHEVVRAREDRERLINQAQGYREDVIPKARGRSEQMIREAEAYEQERFLQAQGDAERFLKLLEEYTKAQRVTRTRLYLETVERVLKNAKITVVDPHIGSGVTSLLPLGDFRQSARQASKSGEGL